MTLGIDVSPLFSEMIMAGGATTDLVQKKMVYLYLVNYAESNAELALLAVNTLQKDCRDDDPMIRGLALRSLCSLSLLNMVEYLMPAVQKGLEDVNGYVRKTAVIGAVKLYYISKTAVVDSEILPGLRRLLHDNDPHVIANTLNALEEILADEGGLVLTRETVTLLLNRIDRFSEWGQCAVLNALASYQVENQGVKYSVSRGFWCSRGNCPSKKEKGSSKLLSLEVLGSQGAPNLTLGCFLKPSGFAACVFLCTTLCPIHLQQQLVDLEQICK